MVSVYRAWLSLCPLVPLLGATRPCAKHRLVSQLSPTVPGCPLTPCPRRYLCCDTQADLREWFATFLHVQVGSRQGQKGAQPFVVPEHPSIPHPRDGDKRSPWWPRATVPVPSPCPLCPQHGGSLWPSESSKVRASRWQQDARLGNVSLIPLRGDESEMRKSVAAFATDPLTVSDTPGRGDTASPLPHTSVSPCPGDVPEVPLLWVVPSFPSAAGGH